ncbi:MAG: CapA family protein [Eubacteriales bacterium]|nr:CapA family protein [Eubacteriales bacterium]
MAIHPSKQCRFSALIILALMIFGFMPIHAAAGELTIAPLGDIRPYSPGAVTLSLPEAGEMSIFAQIGHEKIPLFSALQVQAGTLSLPFQGLSMSGEPLPRGDIALVARLASSNQVHEARVIATVLKPSPAIQYAILSRESLPAQGGEDLIVDYQLTNARQLNVTIARADDPGTPVRNWALLPKDASARHFRWDKTIAGKPAEPGDYIITFSLKGSSQPALSQAFTLVSQQPIAPDISPTIPGEWLPMGMDAPSVWKAITAPAVVVDIGEMDHQNIFAAPSAQSGILGFVHGQTAGLEVLETGVFGYARVRAARHGDGEMVTGYVPERKLRTIMPDTRYGLLIDKASQTLRLYAGGEYIGMLAVSTGVYVPPGKNAFETLSGAFLTRDRIATFRQEGFQYDYAIRIDGGNLLHQIGYQVRDGRDFSQQQASLGEKASHGCVRIDNRPNERMIDAWWLYANLPRNTKVLVVEDAAKLDLVQPKNTVRAIADPLPALTPFTVQKEIAGEVTAILSFAGDCVLGSEEATRRQADSFDTVVAQKGFSWPFSGFTEFFGRDDLTMVNLENVLMDVNRDRDLRRLHNFRGPVEYAQILPAGGVEAVNIANNHFPDYGAAGKRSTRDALTSAGVAYAGYSALYIYEKDGVKIGFAGIRETIYHQDKSRIAREVAELKAEGCHYVVYAIHAGEEYSLRHNALQAEMAHAAIEAGANLIIGHHPHVPQGIEVYGGGLIFYSLGNFVFGGNLALSTFDSLVAQITLQFKKGVLLQSQVQLIPVLTSGASPENDFRPIPALGEDKLRILETVNRDSDQAYPEFFTIPGLQAVQDQLKLP